MSDTPENTVSCGVCGRTVDRKDAVCGALVRRQIQEIIKRHVPDWTADKCICEDDLAEYRHRYVASIVHREKRTLDRLEREVLDSIQHREMVTDDVNHSYNERLTFGQRAADSLASFGGSWRFIIIFSAVLASWITLNSIALLRHPFDPFPYILLNLVLSCLAAIQAPVIMMSQNRQEAKDRLRAENDYKINLKAEIEIRTLHEKLDHLLTSQWKRMAELQEIQVEILETLRKKIEK